LVIIGAALALLPSAASAITFNRSAANNATITATAAAGETNNLTVTRAGSVYTFAETGANSYSLTGAAGCTGTDTSPPTVTVTCNDTFGSADIDDIVATLGDGNDTFTAGTVTGMDDGVTMNGDAGNDTMTGANSTGVLEGAPTDNLNGGIGTDRMTGLAGIDIYNGGADIDRAVLNTGATSAASITLDGVANDNDGDGNGNDNVQANVESITGTTMGDSLTGSCQANTFAGSPGTTSGTTDGADNFVGDPAGCLASTTDGTEMDFFGGGEGNDVFDGDGSGNDGFDTVTYSAPFVYAGAEAITVSIGGGANDNDGWGNTTENINADIERILGSSGNDSIDATGFTVVPASGTEVGQLGVQLFGRLANDTLTDSPGDDLLNGEGGTDTGNCPNGGTNVIISIEAGSCLIDPN
jgi:Ca2+-binding RTX toxin-like protein